MRRAPADGLSRRELLAAGAAAAGAVAAERAVAATGAWRVVRRTEFGGLGDRHGWPGWRCAGVANLRCADGVGLLEAGSDVYPNDPRPVAFALDCRLRDAEVTATLERPGGAPGVVVRRTAPRAWYAAIYDAESAVLRLVAREEAELRELAAAPAAPVQPPLVLTLRATGASPSKLVARLVDARGRAFGVEARDSTPALQRAGEPGVLATAQTLFPSDPNPVLPALGNLHLLPWSVQEGQAVMATEPGQAVVAEIRRRSTAGFAEIVVRAPSAPRRSRPAIVAATTGTPVAGGARLQIAADMPARVSIELSESPRLSDPRTLDLGETGAFAATTGIVRGLAPGRRIWWRARLERRGRTSLGPVRSFRVLGPEMRAPIRIAVGSCASQFGPIFGHLADSEPDAFVWQGDLNYPDTHGPLSQTNSGYAGIWRDFLANPTLAPVLAGTAFAAQRDDHDFAVQDANETTIPEYPWGLSPWEALVNPRPYHRFPAGSAEVWVLDQRRFKSDPALPDGPRKTLLGARQRRWLERTLAASAARFKVICSPTTVFMAANARDGNWAVGYEHERARLLEHIGERVSGTVIFLTGDTHLTGVYDDGRGFEARAAPLCIPRPNDITLVDPLAAERLRRAEHIAYAGDESHFTLLDVSGQGRDARLELTLVREDGKRVYARTFAAG